MADLGLSGMASSLAGSAASMAVQPALALCVLAAGCMFMLGLLTGIWKFAQMWRSKRGLAHPYVDIAHRAALLYSFACVLLGVLSLFSQWSARTDFYAVLFPIVYFYAAVFSYMLQGLLSGPDNQMRQPHRFGQFSMPRAALGAFMGSLIVAEVAGVAVLLWGVVQHPAVRNLPATWSSW
jgi:hypothetical protein